MDSIIFLVFIVPIIAAFVVSYIIFINLKAKDSPNKWSRSVIAFILVGIILFGVMFLIAISQITFDRGGGF